MPVSFSRRALLAHAPLLLLPGAMSPAFSAESKPLPIPPLLERDAQGRLNLEIRHGTTAFVEGRPSDTAGYNGAYLGPTVRLLRGEQAPFSITNRLREATTVHWHGMLVPAEVDGGPHNTIAPGASWQPVLPVAQPAMTGWYHAHPHHHTAPQVYSGLAGMLIVDERDGPAVLPTRYGIDDLPLILQDKALDGDGRMFYPRQHMFVMHGMRGNAWLVNGALRPTARVPLGLVRLRIVNASNARTWDLAFEDGRTFYWIATDGGLLRAPVALTRLELASGQRAEVLVDFSDGRAATLVNRPDAPLMATNANSGRPMPDRPASPLMHFVADRSLAPAPVVLPTTLASWTTPVVDERTPRRRFTLATRMRPGAGGHGLHQIDGRSFDHHRIDHQVRLGSTEVWQVSGDMLMAHPFHIHGVHFEVLSRGRQPPPARDQGRRDTVMVDQPVELLVTFTQAAKEMPFMYHCHILEHEDAGMMGQFTVT